MAVPSAYSSTQSNCAVATVDVCEPATVCSGTTTSGCYTAGSSVPAYVLAPSEISSIAGVQVNGHALIGPISSGSCGSGNPASFLSDFGEILAYYAVRCAAETESRRENSVSKTDPRALR